MAYLAGKLHADHYPAITRFTFSAPRAPQRWIPDWNKTDWTHFRDTFHELISTQGPLTLPPDTESLERLVNVVSSSLQETIMECVPLKSVNDSSKAWWSDVIWKLRKNMNKAHNRWRHTRHPHDRRTYIGARRLFRQEVKRAKTRLWHEFCENTNDNNMWDKFQRITGKHRHHNIRGIKDQAGNLLHSKQEQAHQFKDTFFPPSSTTPNDYTVGIERECNEW